MELVSDTCQENDFESKYDTTNETLAEYYFVLQTDRTFNYRTDLQYV